MDTIESVRGAKELRWSLAGATYSAHLRNLMGFDTHFIEGLSDLAGNGIVTTTGAQRRGSSFVIGDSQASAVDFLRFRCANRHD